MGLSVALVFSAVASDPAWWHDRGAVAPQYTTNSNGTVTTNYTPQPNAAVTVGQLKQFTARAVDELNANLADGAGTNLNSLVGNWAADYATNGYGPTNYKSSDSSVANVGQLKYIGNKVWSRLVSEGYTNAVPSWMAQNTNTDNYAAAVGQVKTVFNFDFSAMSGGSPLPVVTSPTTAVGSVGVVFSYSITATQSPTHFGASSLPGGLAVNSSSGVISGTPSISGVFAVTVSATNGSGTGTGVVVITIGAQPSAPVINSDLALSGVVGESLIYRITATNQPVTFGATGLPSGLTINSQTGVISGKTSAGSYSIAISAGNGAGTDSKTLVLTVTSAPPTGGALPVIISSLPWLIPQPHQQRLNKI